MLSGNDSHTLLTCLLLYSLYKCKFVNNSIIRKADFLTANDYIANADVKRIQLLGKADDRKSSTLFDDDLDNANNSSDKTVLSKILDNAIGLPGGSNDSNNNNNNNNAMSKHTRGSSIFDDGDDKKEEEDDELLQDTKQTSITTNNDPS